MTDEQLEIEIGKLAREVLERINGKIMELVKKILEEESIFDVLMISRERFLENYTQRSFHSDIVVLSDMIRSSCQNKERRKKLEIIFHSKNYGL